MVLSSITTIQDLIDMKKLEGLRLIAGADGLNREVNTCCILDYEYDPELKNKFSHINFRPGMFLLTSFLYAKDAEYLITDAIRQMISSGISGLAIRNVYHLHIQDSIIRYANSLNFPIFLIEDSKRFVEIIIRSIHEGINLRSQLYRHEEIINSIIHKQRTSDADAEKALELYPMMGHYYVAYYFRCDEPASQETWVSANDFLRSYHKHMLYQYYDGALLLCSVEIPDLSSADAECKDIVSHFRTLLPGSIGVSNIHFAPEELRDAIKESVYASMVAKTDDLMHYKDIGVYQILFNIAKTENSRRFSERILRPLYDYDAQNESRLHKTLFGLVECNGNLRALSEMLGQHENTIRQRIARIATLTGLDARKTEDYEQLSMAVKIQNCIDWTESINF